MSKTNKLQELRDAELDAVTGGIARSMPNGRTDVIKQWETRNGVMSKSVPARAEGEDHAQD